MSPHRAPLPTPGSSTQSASSSTSSGKREKKVQVIGEYEVIDVLGTGSFGKVKLARHTKTGLKVAMKFISKRKISTAEMSARVHREIQYLSLLRHPHIIKLYDVISTNTDIIMVIEYLSGELFDYIVKRGKMPEAEARRFFQQIISALEYCHSHNIVHRDLKPENLLLDDNMNVKIADFGLSNIMRDGDFLKTSCGSPNYAAPEVISGKLYAGPEIDVWSCGVILYVMLCGRLPFDEDHIPMLFKKINNGVYALPPFLSQDTRTLLTRMLTVDSNKRIKLHEIRQLPWFQKDLAPYLFPPLAAHFSPRPDDVDVDELKGCSEHVEEAGQAQMRDLREDADGHSEGGSTRRARSADGDSEGDEPKTPTGAPGELDRRLRALTPSRPGANGDEDDAANPSGRRREWVEGLGVVDQEVVDDLCEKIPSLGGADEVWGKLKEGRDRELRIAYQLCRDNMRMRDGSHYEDHEAVQQFYAPPGDPRARQPTLRRRPAPGASDSTNGTSSSGLDSSNGNGSEPISTRPTTIRVLESSLRRPLDDPELASLLQAPPLKPTLRRFNSPLKALAQPLTPTASSSGGGGGEQSSHGGAGANGGGNGSGKSSSSKDTQKRLRQRWHFGIRSRSEPMEVMLEIYRTLKALKMEWRVRSEDQDDGEGKENEGGGSGSETPEERERRRNRRKDEDDRMKKANELYFVETRCRMDDVMVRMDLQLYRIDDQNYLVDFRNLGYRPIRPTSTTNSNYATAPHSRDVSPAMSLAASPTLGNGAPDLPSLSSSLSTSSNNTADELRSRRPDILGSRRASLVPTPSNPHPHSHSRHPSAAIPRGRQPTAAEVTSPYLFLECAVNLIVELANPSPATQQAMAASAPGAAAGAGEGAAATA
ncbi:hypothetical protein JCM8097_008827 [Rhodosporidiobolus ruineniae]